ncbi:MAG: hypothetical protein M3072_01805 [Candidatus Dormibacteraeota bacterium]|nr:hypothetical protein [Candidatus Dormibacteraeota bacterium]
MLNVSSQEDQDQPFEDWFRCRLSEHLAEVRKQDHELAYQRAYSDAQRVTDALDLLQAAIADLVDHADGLHGAARKRLETPRVVVR